MSQMLQQLPEPLWAMILIAAAAGVVRGFTGFGAGLILVPSYILLLGPTLAVPIVVLLDAVASVRKLVSFFVHEHNACIPHSAFHGQAPDEMYFGTGDKVPDELDAAKKAARKKRMEVNRSLSCATCDPEMN